MKRVVLEKKCQMNLLTHKSEKKTKRKKKNLLERGRGIVMARVKPQAMLIVLSLAVIVLTAMVLGIDRVPGLGVVALAGALTKLVEKD